MPPVAVEAFRLADSLSESAYDDATRLAATICGSQAALLFFHDGDQQWFPSKFGTDAIGAARACAFCAETVRQPRHVMVVPDTASDPRFADHPLVLEQPQIRFYAGVPLLLPSGDVIGTLCVLDTSAHALTQPQIDSLVALSRQVVAQFQLRRLVTMLAVNNETLSHQSLTDPLTGVPNRRAYNERWLEELARARRTMAPLSILLIDIDHFKSYNDNFGHQAGDTALQIVARVMHQHIRKYDFLARFGGEEFALILPGTDSTEAAAVANRIRGLIANTPNPHRRITVSIGVASLQANTSSDPDHLFDAADRSLYAAKAAGRNCVVAATP